MNPTRPGFRPSYVPAAQVVQQETAKPAQAIRAPTPSLDEPATPGGRLWRDFAIDLVQLLERTPAALAQLDMQVGLSERYARAKSHLPPSDLPPPATKTQAAMDALISRDPAPAKPTPAATVRRPAVPVRPAPLATEPVVASMPADPAAFLASLPSNVIDEEPDSDPGDDLGDADAAYRVSDEPEPDPMNTLEGEPDAVLITHVDQGRNDGWDNPHRLGTEAAFPPRRTDINVPMPPRRAAEELPDWLRPGTSSGPETGAGRIHDETERRSKAKGLTR